MFTIQRGKQGRNESKGSIKNFKEGIMKQTGWKRKGVFFLFGFFLFLIPNLSLAQDFPTKPINILITFSPGGSADPSMRLPR
jgi:hypothetical protein